MERQHRLGAEAWLKDSLVVQDLVEKASVSLVVVRRLLGRLFISLDQGGQKPASTSHNDFFPHGTRAASDAWMLCVRREG